MNIIKFVSVALWSMCMLFLSCKKENLDLYLEPHNNQKQSEISKRKSLITNTFYKLTLFGCFLSLPKFPHIFDTYF